MSKAVKITIGLIVLAPIFYVTSCSLISNQRERGFARVKEGDSEFQVISLMGKPVDRETVGNRLPQYGIAECIAPCAQRLWYPNKLSFVGEAWAVEFDGSGHVVHTAHIVSP